MSAHNSNRPYSESNLDQTHLDQARLDEAVRRADDLLVSSLKTEDRRRSRRKLLLGAGFAVLAASGGGDCRFVDRRGAARLDGRCGRLRRESRRVSAEGWQLWQKQNLKPAIEKPEAAVNSIPRTPPRGTASAGPTSTAAKRRPLKRRSRK